MALPPTPGSMPVSTPSLPMSTPARIVAGTFGSWKVRGVNWSDEETNALLETWMDPAIQFEMENASRKQHVYTAIANALQARGIARSMQQCRVRIKNLKTEYKAFLESALNAPDGVPPTKHFKYFEQISRICGRRLPGLGGFGFSNDGQFNNNVSPDQRTGNTIINDQQISNVGMFLLKQEEDDEDESGDFDEPSGEELEQINGSETTVENDHFQSAIRRSVESAPSTSANTTMPWSALANNNSSASIIQFPEMTQSSFPMMTSSVWEGGASQSLADAFAKAKAQGKGLKRRCPSVPLNSPHCGSMETSPNPGSMMNHQQKPQYQETIGTTLTSCLQLILNFYREMEERRLQMQQQIELRRLQIEEQRRREERAHELRLLGMLARQLGRPLPGNANEPD